MKHVSSGKEQTLTSAFRAKRRFLSLMMQEKFYFMIHFLIHVTETNFDPFIKTVSMHKLNATILIFFFKGLSGSKKTLSKIKSGSKLRTFLKEKETINFENVHSSIRKRTNYKSPKMKKVINFIVPLSGR